MPLREEEHSHPQKPRRIYNSGMLFHHPVFVLANKVGIYFAERIVKLKGFVIKKSHISCILSCYSDIYWRNTTQSPRQKNLAHSLAHLSKKSIFKFIVYFVSCLRYSMHVQRGVKLFQLS